MGNSGITALLFSGGIDSTAIAWWKRPDKLLTIDYGQRTAVAEIESSKCLAGFIGIPHELLHVDLKEIGLGSLYGGDPSRLSDHPEWWPFRNQMLITVAAAWSVANDVDKLLIGTVKSDSCFGDGTKKFVDAMKSLLQLQEGSIQLEAPALDLDSFDLVKVSGMPREHLLLCFSCSVALDACGTCRSCLKYRSVLHSSGLL